MSSSTPIRAQRVDELVAHDLGRIHRQTDRLFAYLMALQWVGGIVAALVVAPRTWIGATSDVNAHVWAAVLLGGLIAFLPIHQAITRPGMVLTRHVIAGGQVLTSALLIHLTGGRIETHFHVFGSLAFLAFYRDWRVLITPTVLVALDHGARGVYWPESVYGITGASSWRWLEHTAWVLFEDTFLVLSILQARTEMRAIAERQVLLAETNARIELAVAERTAELDRRRQEAETAQARLGAESRFNETLHRVGASFARELDHRTLVQLVTDEAHALAGAEFSAFFVNRTDEEGARYFLYTLSGAPAQAFAGFPLPRATPIFRPTFEGEGVVRLEDVTKDPRFGAWGPQPRGHLPVRSYLAVPVRSVRGEVLGGLFLAHGEPGRFTDQHERMICGLAAQAAIALRNAQLYDAARVSEEKARSAYQAATEADRRKDEFLAMLGHELRNPLAPILTALQLMQLRGVGGERERGVLERQVKHLVRLVDDLLDMARITGGKVELNRRRVEMAAVVAKAIETASPLFERKRQQVSLSVPPRGLVVDGDEVRLAQVFANLLTNSAKFTPPGGHVSIAAEREGAQAVVRVRDSGCGITPELLPRVFDLFVQGERPLDRSDGGLGLGLTLVRTLVRQHGGEVEASSAGAGQGSEFVVRLPVVDAGASPPAPEEPSVSELVPGSTDARRVLVVDDNVDAVESLAEVLVELGHAVRTAGDGPSALEVLRTFDPDVAILDIGLPVMDGYELARRIRAIPARAPVRLLALTGYGQDSDRARARQAGFHEHFVKPLDLSRLVAAVADAPRAVLDV